MPWFSLDDIFYFDVGFDDTPEESKRRPAIIMIQEGEDQGFQNLHEVLVLN